MDKGKRTQLNFNQHNFNQLKFTSNLNLISSRSLRARRAIQEIKKSDIHSTRQLLIPSQLGPSSVYNKQMFVLQRPSNNSCFAEATVEIDVFAYNRAWPQ